MTDEQLKKGQELKRIISTLDGELEKFEGKQPNGINVYLPNVGSLIEDVRKVFLAHKEMFNRQFKEL